MSESERQLIVHYDNELSGQETCGSRPSCLLECYLELVSGNAEPSSMTKTVTRTKGESPDKFIVGAKQYDLRDTRTRTDASKELPDRSLMQFRPI